MAERIGDILKKLGYINDNQIMVAEKIKKIYPAKRFGEILKELYFVSSQEIAKAISIQSGKEYINLENVVPDKEALSAIDKDTSLQHKFIVLELNKKSKTATVAMADPYNVVAIDILNRMLSVDELKVLVAEEEKITRYIRNYYYKIENPLKLRLDNILSKLIKDGAANVASDVVDLILTESIVNGATDIHISPQNSTTDIFLRIDGVMEHFISLPKTAHTAVSSRIKVLSGLDIAEQRLPQDGSFSYSFMGENFEFRVSTLPTIFGENIVLRVLSKDINLINLDSIGFRTSHKKIVKRLLNKSKGLILVTGPTGSGKTTTLYAMLRTVNALQRNIITVEDPVEYKFPFIRQSQINDKINFNFARATRAILRQDPDVVLIGEIRDRETAETAVKAAITGHLVLSTLHANSAIGSIPRLLEFNIPSYLIASALLAVMAQRLVRKLCPFCKQKYTYSYNDLLRIGLSKSVLDKYNVKQIDGYKATGCEKCRWTGYLGRKSVVEIIESDAYFLQMIEENQPITKISRYLEEKGMRTMEEMGLIDIAEGITTPEEIVRVIV